MKLKKTLPIIISLIAFCVLTHVVVAPPLPPCAFYGYVNVGTKRAPDGLIVMARIRDTELNWTTETCNGTYGWPNKGSSKPNGFSIPSDDTTTTEREGAVSGNIIEFYVNGTKTSQTAVFIAGDVKRLNLAIGGSPSALYKLTIETKNSGTTSPSPGSEMYDEGTVVSVIALPNLGWNLSYWQLDNQTVGNANPYNVTMNGNHTLTAVFAVASDPTVQNFMIIGASAAVIVGIGSVIVWSRRKGYGIRITKHERHSHESNK